MIERAIALMIGYTLDLVFGDPHFLWHPVQGIGKLIQWLQRLLEGLFQIDLCSKDKRNGAKEMVAGGVMVLLVITFTTGIVTTLLLVAECIHPYVRILLESVMCYQILATKSLKTESMKVYTKLKENNLMDARKAVSMIVGRDTDSLGEDGVIKATVETIAENTSDGVIAPMFFLLLGGPVFGFVYKAVNTMDSMIGYKNEQYLHFGRIAAKLDDCMNYIPARVAAFLMIASSFLLRLDGKGAIFIYKRDRYNHASPNSAQTEAVCAGALSTQLAGDAYYFGILHHKKTIGDAKRAIEVEDIKKANRLLYLTSVLSLFLSIGILLIATFLLN